MMLLTWSDRFSVDILEVDAEHRHLFDLCNRFSAATLAPADPPGPGGLLGDLIAFFERHAETEARIMLAAGYAEHPRHDDEHRRFHAELRATRESAAAGRLVLGPSVAGFVRDWLLNHIQIHDKPLYEALNPDQVSEARRLLGLVAA